MEVDTYGNEFLMSTIWNIIVKPKIWTFLSLCYFWVSYRPVHYRVGWEQMFSCFGSLAFVFNLTSKSHGWFDVNLTPEGASWDHFYMLSNVESSFVLFHRWYNSAITLWMEESWFLHPMHIILNVWFYLFNKSELLLNVNI